MLTIELASNLPNDGKPNEKKQIEMTEKIILSVLERSSKLEQDSFNTISGNDFAQTLSPSKNHRPSCKNNKGEQQTSKSAPVTDTNNGHKQHTVTTT
jgi:hypothetical protein